MPSEAKRSSESDRAAICGWEVRTVQRYIAVCGHQECLWQQEHRTAESAEVDAMHHDVESHPGSIGIPPPGGQTFPNLRLMLTHQRYYSKESAEAELRAVLDFVDGKR